MALLASGAAGAQDKTLYWDRYDVDITVQTNGDLRVVETQELVFTVGTFSYGVRSIPFLRLQDITGIIVAEAGGREYVKSASAAPYTFQVRRVGDELEIQYNFPPTAGGRRTIVIGYTVVGALRFYPQDGMDQLDWKAIPAGNPFGTSASTITLHAPEGAGFTSYGLWGAQGEASFEPGRRNGAIRLIGYIPAGQEVEVVAQWPHGMVSGGAPAWQLALDAQVRRLALLDLAAVVSGLLLAIAGPLLVYLWWYRKGRTKPAGLVADYLVEPPEGMTPALAAALLDVQSTRRAILATIYDLVRRGVLRIAVENDSGNASKDAWNVVSIQPCKPASGQRGEQEPGLGDFERAVVRKLFPSGDSRPVKQLGALFANELPWWFSILCDETMRRGYHRENRADAADRRGRRSLVLLWVADLAGLAVLATQNSGDFWIAFLVAVWAVPVLLTLIRKLPFLSLLGRIDLGVAAPGHGFASRRIYLWYGLYGYLVVTALALFYKTSPLIWAPFGLGITAFALACAAPRMVPLTPAGAEMAARCLAFKRYLSNIKQYTQTQDAAAIDAGAILDRYQPYAVAFDIDKTWLEEPAPALAPAEEGETLFERLRTTLAWHAVEPERRARRTHTPSWWNSTLPDWHGERGDHGRPSGVEIPHLDSDVTIHSTLDGMSRSAGNSLGTASSSLGSTLADIAQALLEIALSSSSKSGGGSRSGGGSGGGGSRFG